MKRVLIIGFYYHDEEKVASVRIRGLVNNLHRNGWHPTLITTSARESDSTTVQDDHTIVTVHHKNLLERTMEEFGLVSVHQVSDRLGVQGVRARSNIVEKLSNIVNWCYDTKIGNYKLMEKIHRACMEQIRANEFDAILSTSSPTLTHRMACRLHRETGIPWMADLRDLWADNHYDLHNVIFGHYQRKLECWCLSKAMAISTVSEPLRNILALKYGNSRTHTIQNGFDPAIVNQASADYRKTGPLIITYTGVLYKGRRDPGLLFQALRMLLDQKLLKEGDVEVNFYGRFEPWMQTEIETYGLEGIVNMYGQVSREESLKAQRDSHILLLLTWNNPAEEGVLTGKVFDYLAARKPIIHIGYEGGSVSQLLERTRAGRDFTGHEELAAYIYRCYCGLIDKSQIAYDVDEQEMQLNTHENMARAFASVLDGLV